jgi:hypothetical protein
MNGATPPSKEPFYVPILALYSPVKPWRHNFEMKKGVYFPYTSSRFTIVASSKRQATVKRCGASWSRLEDLSRHYGPVLVPAIKPATSMRESMKCTGLIGPHLDRASRPVTYKHKESEDTKGSKQNERCDLRRQRPER